MADKLNAVNVTSGTYATESNNERNVESKTLGSDKGNMSVGGIRVLGEGSSKVLELVDQLSKRGSGMVGGSGSGSGSGSGVAENVVQDDRWKSWGITDVVDNLLDRSNCMDGNVVGDVENCGGSGVEVDPMIAEASFADMNTWQGMIEEPTFGAGFGIKGSGIGSDSVVVDLGDRGVGNDLYGNQDSVSNELVTGGGLVSEKFNDVAAGDVSVVPSEMVPRGKLESEDIYDFVTDVLEPSVRGPHDLVEKEGHYYVSDLVWGKVRSHPWWPGQICSPKAATEKAARYFKRGCYLIAYSGDGTFAWNDVPAIKPFRMYFSQLEKQSNNEWFRYAVDCAVDELARRVEYGLSCPCLAKEVRDKIKFQTIANAGVDEKYCRRDGGDNLYTAALFSPRKLMQFIALVAVAPQVKPDRLELVVRKSQLLAVYRWKGRQQLAVFEERGVLLEDVTQWMESSEGVNEILLKKRMSNARDGSSKKRGQIRSGDEDGSKMKKKKLAKSSGKRTNSSGKSSSGATSRIGGQMAGKPQEWEDLPVDVLLLKLQMLAQNPRGKFEDTAQIISWGCAFRNSVCIGKPTDAVGTEGTEDSYWTDRVIEANTGGNVNLETNDNKERGVVIMDLDPEEPEEHRPTALILYFDELENIPPIARLNEIFRSYGPLRESQTKISGKKSARVIFKRAEDAQRAYSSTGKYDIFGEALMSYKLELVHNTPSKKKAKLGKKNTPLKINSA